MSHSLASLTGADVAASDDITGHQTLGGDWDFEYTVGLVESDVAFSQTVQQNWEHSLVVTAESGGQIQSFGIDGAGRTTTVASIESEGTENGLDVRLQFTDQFGNVTTDILVNETLAGDQLYASVAVAENGSKAVTWTSISTTGERAVFAKFYDGNNSVVRGEFRVDVPTAGVDADDSSIAIDAAGNVVIVWESTDSGVSEILAQRFNVDGSPDGDVFNVSGTGYNGSDEAANAFVAANDSGQFVVVWDTHDGTSNDRSDIYARTFNADGTENSHPRLIQGSADFQHTQASADIDSNGNFVVAYTVNDLDSNDGLDVRAEGFTFNTSGVQAYDDFVAESDGDQSAASVAILDSGEVRIVWQGESGDNLLDAFGATVDFATANVLTNQASFITSLFDEPGASRSQVSVITVGNDSFAANAVNELDGTEGIVNEGLPGGNNNQTPTGSDETLTLDEDGALTINASNFGFGDTDGGTFTQVQISRVPQNGLLLLNGSEVTNGQVILASDLQLGGLLYVPDADFSGQDDLLFFVHDGTNYADSFSTLSLDVQPVVDGFSLSPAESYVSVRGGIPVNTSIPGDQDSPNIAALQDGGYVVVYQSDDTDLTSDSDGDGNPDDGTQIYYQRFDAANNPIGDEVLVGGNLAGDQINPSVITLADGSILIAATTSVDGLETDVFAQRFDLGGNVLLADGSFDVNQNTTISLAQHIDRPQDLVSLTARDDGGFIATWSTFSEDIAPSSGLASVARIFDSNGNPGDEFLLHEPDSNLSPADHR